MAQLNFPDPNTTQTYTEAGITWTWNSTLQVWSAEAGTGGSYLSKVNDDTAAGAITFEGLTTHEGGVSVTGGDKTSVSNGLSKDGTLFLYSSDSSVNIVSESEDVHLVNTNTAHSYSLLNDGRYFIGKGSNSQYALNFNPEPNSASNGILVNQKASSTATGVVSLDVKGDVSNVSGNLNYLRYIQVGSASNSQTTGDVAGIFAHRNIGDGGENAYGFYSELSNDIGNATNKYNFYAAGNAPNYFAGTVETQNGVLANATGSPPGGLGDRYCMMISTSNPVFEWVTNVTSERNAFSISNGNGNISNIVSNSRETIFRGEGSNTVRIQSPSDYRLKTDINPISSASDAIKALNPITYRMIAYPDKLMSGFIAHELKEQLPEAVTGDKDATEAIGTLIDYDGTELETEVAEPPADELEYTEEVETDGVATMVTRTRTWTPTGTQPVYQGVDQTKLIPLLTKALQEALNRIEALESNEVVDDATDSALLTLVANLATRVTALEGA